MTGFCLPKFAADAFKAKIKDGTIQPEKLSEMTSRERRAFFEDIVGKDLAEQVNASFESKLILKDQQAGMLTWAKQLTGIKPEVRRDMLSKINRLDQVLQPEEAAAFLEDLAARSLGFRTSVEQANTIVELAQRVEAAKAPMLPDSTFPTVEEKLDYGHALFDFIDYTGTLKEQAERRTLKETATDIYKDPGRTFREVAGFTKTIKASLDDSALLNQGIKMLAAHPVLWSRNALNSFKDIYETFGGKKVMRELMSDILSDPEAINGTYRKMKLGVGITEESFPSSAPGRIPYAGAAFRAADNAFTGFQYRNRRDAARLLLKVRKEMGDDISDKTILEPMGKLINSLTGRGNLGRYEPATDTFNTVFFSPRFFKSHLDTLFLHPFGPNVDPFVRREAQKNLLKYVAGIAVALAIAKILSPKDVELDTRSSNSGKIRIFGHWTDITGGAGSIITLASRFALWSTKSASTGKVSRINSGDFGSVTNFDLFTNFFDKKLSPIAGIIRDHLKNEDPNGNKPGLVNDALNLTVPIPVTTLNSLMADPNKWDIVGSMIVNSLGANVSTYAQTVSGTVAEDKPMVVEEMLGKMANGDLEGAKALARDFNAKFKEQIQEEIEKKNPSDTEDEITKKVNARYKKDAIYLPSSQDVKDYEAGKKDAVAKASNNGALPKEPGYSSIEFDEQGIVEKAINYAKAIGTDPVTAFNDLFKGQRIVMVDNGTIYVERLPFKESQAIKEEQGGNNPTMKLDHTVPLELGGNNEKSNLKLITTEEWKRNTPVENYLGKKVKSGDITGRDARGAILDFKEGSIDFAGIKLKYGN